MRFSYPYKFRVCYAMSFKSSSRHTIPNSPSQVLVISVAWDLTLEFRPIPLIVIVQRHWVTLYGSLGLRSNPHFAILRVDIPLGCGTESGWDHNRRQRVILFPGRPFRLLLERTLLQITLCGCLVRQFHANRRVGTTTTARGTTPLHTPIRIWG